MNCSHISDNRTLKLNARSKLKKNYLTAVFLYAIKLLLIVACILFSLEYIIPRISFIELSETYKDASSMISQLELSDPLPDSPEESQAVGTLMALIFTVIPLLLFYLAMYISSIIIVCYSLYKLLCYPLLIGPLTIGYNRFLMNTEEKNPFSLLLSGFDKFYFNTVLTLFLSGTKLILWYLLFFIPGVIKAHQYTMIPYIISDNPSLSSKEVFKISKIIMQGQKARLFSLELSFFGWYVLFIITNGISIFFTAPYYKATIIELYEELKSHHLC